MSSEQHHTATHHTITAFFATNTFDACLACAINQVATPIGTAPEYVTEEAVIFYDGNPAADLVDELVAAGYKTIRVLCAGELPAQRTYDGTVVTYFAPADF